MAPSEIKPHADLNKHLRFETLLAEISTLFINLPAEEIDSEIEAAQSRICEFLDLDRSTLSQVLEKEPGTLLRPISISLKEVDCLLTEWI